MTAPKYLTYDEVKTQRLEGAMGTEIHGIPLQVQEQTARIGGADFTPIIGCLCVQDSPNNPCPCRDIVIWLPIRKIIKSAETTRKSVDGAALHSFTISNDAEILVEERVRSYNVKDFKQASEADAKLHEALAQARGLLSAGVARKPNRVIVQIIKTVIIAVIDWMAEGTIGPGAGMGPPSSH